MKEASRKLGLLVSANTLFRRIQQFASRPYQTLRVLGIYDFAICKLHNYGTILIDLETCKPIDLQSDRESKIVSEWFKTHFGERVVAQGRSPIYTDSITLGAPVAK